MKRRFFLAGILAAPVVAAVAPVAAKTVAKPASGIDVATNPIWRAETYRKRHTGLTAEELQSFADEMNRYYRERNRVWIAKNPRYVESAA